MAESIEKIRRKLVGIFPRLANDPHFEITSSASLQYNCAAWAYQVTDKWMCPKSAWEVGSSDDLYFWPDGLEDNTEIVTFVQAFEMVGYRLCEDWKHEVGYHKVALYAWEGANTCSHASREVMEDKANVGRWTSKLGEENDIQHGSPYELEGHVYGEVCCIMKKTV
jgi:hypothetical protein